LANIVLPHFFDLLGVELHPFFPEYRMPPRFEQFRIERLRLPSRFQVSGQLPALEDALDLGNEGWNFRSELGIGLGGFEEVQEFLTDEIIEGLLPPEIVVDVPTSFALLDPNLVKLHRDLWASRIVSESALSYHADAAK
jgi:hypothetical protein